MNSHAKFALSVARQIQAEANEISKPPLEGRKPRTDLVVDFHSVEGTPGYIESVVDQVNGTYENAWYDACAVMLRRLFETLIIEFHIRQGIDGDIKDNGEFVPLANLIEAAKKESKLSLTRDSKRLLPRIKSLGDKSAHSPTFNAKRTNIEKLSKEAFLDIDAMVQEFVKRGNLKRTGRKTK